MRYEILNDNGSVLNVINASQSFVDEQYPGRYRLVDEVVPVAPKPLTQLEFIRLCRSAGGSTPEMIVAAKKDALLEYMWMEFQMAHGVEKGDPGTAEGLSALQELGYLPNGAQAVLDAWPSA